MNMCVCIYIYVAFSPEVFNTFTRVISMFTLCQPPRTRAYIYMCVCYAYKGHAYELWNPKTLKRCRSQLWSVGIYF